MTDADILRLCRGLNKFTRILRKRQNEHNNDALFSSIGVHAFLTLISQDPWFHVNKALNTALFIDRNEVAAQYRHLFDLLTNVDGLHAANILFFKQCLELSSTFKSRVEDGFASDVKPLDFSNPEDATSATNAWFGENIAQELTGFNLPDEVNLTFLNATHFKSAWADPFVAEDTATGSFHVSAERTIEVPMMRKKGEFFCGDCRYANARVLKLPFAQSDVSLVIILPNDVVNISEFENQIIFEDLTDLTISRDMVKSELDVSLPKFKIDETLALSEYLKVMHLQDVFTSSLIGMVDGEAFTCNEIHQKVFLDVNETGAEATAGTRCPLIKYHDEKTVPKNGLVVYEAKISSVVSNRFAETKVVWRVKNTYANAADAQFKVILTETAFITEFIMEIEGTSYKSYIKKKEEAKSIFNKAVARGQSAGLVEAKTRDSREFTVSVNLEPDAVAVFSLTYEEMLQRLHDQYELVLNICPGQIVDDLDIEVRINETRPLKFVRTPPLRSGNGMSMAAFDRYLEPNSDIKTINAKTATVKFRPDASKQQSLAHYLRCEKGEGLTGQFVVQYDVEREPCNGEVLLQDGYFVHFFASNDLDPLPKHVLFVLDTSGSMAGRKIEQLQDAMTNILGQLRKEDMLSLVEFNSEVKVWDVESKKSTEFGEDKIKDFKEPFAYLKKCILADPQRVSDRIISNAKEVVQSIRADGGTFMIGGLETALYLVRTGHIKTDAEKEKLQPIVIFLTDGEPNVGVSSTDQIVDLVTQVNAKDTVPIFSLSFGDLADKQFLRKLSLKNWGFSRHIYEAADASLQLQEFYRQISSPVLHNIKFKYDKSADGLTRTSFPIYFRGSELVVAGRYGAQTFPTCIDCWGPCGPIIIESFTERPVTSLERLWAYLTVRQLLDERDSSPHPKKLTKKAVDLALKYSFVTDVTSLVVVKPKETTTVGDRPSVPGGRRVNACLRGGPMQLSSRISGHVMYSCSMVPDSSKGGYRKSFTRGTPISLMCRSRSADMHIISSSEDFEEDDSTVKSEKKPRNDFTVDRPFLVMLQLEKDDKSIILFRGCVYRPTYKL